MKPYKIHIINLLIIVASNVKCFRNIKNRHSYSCVKY